MEKFYSNFLDRLGIASITDAQGIITYANEKFCEISQYTKDELVGNTHNLINSGYHERSFFRHMWKTIASGQEWRGELCNKAKDGSLYWVDTFITPQLDENGKPIRFFSFRILITDKKNQTLINEKIRNELHEKNQYLNSILNTQSNFFVIRLALDGTYFYVNDALLKKFEFEPSDIIGQPYSFGIHVDDLGLCQLAAHEALSYPGRSSNVKFRKYNSKGEIFLTEWQFVAICNQEGKPVEMQALGFDITDKSRYLEEIDVYKQQIDNILSSIDEVVWSCSAVDFKILSMSKASINLFGYSPEEFYRDEYLLFNIIQKDDLLRFTEHLQRLKLVGASVFEYRIKHKNGKIKHVYDRVTKLKTKDGSYILYGVAADLTNLRHFEEKTKNYEKKLVRTLETIAGAFFLLNTNWEFDYLNDSAGKLLLRTKGELIQRNFWDVFPETKETIVNTKFIDAVNYNKNTHFEAYFEQLNAWFSIFVYPSNEGLAVSFSDITTKKLAEDILKMQNRKFREIAWIQSHKVRSPVANILGLLQILDKKNLANPMNLKVLTMMEKATNSLDEIIHDIVEKANEIGFFHYTNTDEAKVEADQQELQTKLDYA